MFMGALPETIEQQEGRVDGYFTGVWHYIMKQHGVFTPVKQTQPQTIVCYELAYCARDTYKNTQGRPHNPTLTC